MISRLIATDSRDSLRRLTYAHIEGGTSSRTSMSAEKSSAATLPSYRKPPVIEVVCGLRFEPLQKLKIPHIGQFWEKVRKNFPNCEHAPPLGLGPESIDPAVGFPVPRVWLINKADDRLIQVQRDAFIYNWRKRKSRTRYPRYRNIMREFKRTIGVFERYLEESEIGEVRPTECELTYVNHITREHGWQSVSNLGKFVPDLEWRSSSDRFLPDPTRVTWQTTYALPDSKGRLNITLEEAVRKTDDMPMLVLQLSARGKGAEKSPNTLWNWFSVAHEWIVCGFADITSLEVQNEVWERDDDSAG